MDNLQTQIDSLRTLQESYDQIAGAADAYNTGKVELAANITAKGVQASASETLPELADKVSVIAQQPISWHGDDVLETQLFGAPTDATVVYEQPNSPLWNLNVVLANILSDGRFSKIRGVILCEYPKNLATIELMNAGAGGLYLTSDGALYNTDKTGTNAHVWQDLYDGKSNRWVAYLFASPATNYTIQSIDLCPLSIYIGRHVGTIFCNFAGRIGQIVVTDGTEQAPNILEGTNFTNSQTWQQHIVLRNMNHSTGYLFNGNTTVRSVVLENMTISSPIMIDKNTNLESIYIKAPMTMSGVSGDNAKRVLTASKGYFLRGYDTIRYIYIDDGISWGSVGLIHGGSGDNNAANGFLIIDGLKTLLSPIFSEEFNTLYIVYEQLYMDTIEKFSINFYEARNTNGIAFTRLKKLSAKSAKKGLRLSGFVLSTPLLEDVVVGAFEANLNLSKWNPTSVLATAEGIALINENIRDHIAANVADGNNTLTFTVSSNLYNNLEQATLDAFAAKHWLVAGI